MSRGAYKNCGALGKPLSINSVRNIVSVKSDIQLLLAIKNILLLLTTKTLQNKSNIRRKDMKYDMLCSNSEENSV